MMFIPPGQGRGKKRWLVGWSRSKVVVEGGKKKKERNWAGRVFPISRVKRKKSAYYRFKKEKVKGDLTSKNVKWVLKKKDRKTQRKAFSPRVTRGLKSTLKSIRKGGKKGGRGASSRRFPRVRRKRKERE